MALTQATRKTIYYSSIGVGAAIAFYIYILHFNDFSETEMVRLAGVWIYPIVFGVYGFFAERMYTLRQQEGEAAMKDALGSIIIKTMGLGIIMAGPFYIFREEKPLLMALIATLGWIGILEFFFLAIFPAL